MAIILWIVSLFATAIGWLLAKYIESIDLIGIEGLIPAIVWFLVTIVVYFFAGRIESTDWFKILTPTFFITWAFCTVGAIVGALLWILFDSGSLAFSLEEVSSTFLSSLPLTIGPTAGASLGLRSKN